MSFFRILFFQGFVVFKDGPSFIPRKRRECVCPTDKGDLGVLPISNKTLSFRNGLIINQHQMGWWNVRIAFCLISALLRPIVPYFSAIWNYPILVLSMFIRVFRLLVTQIRALVWCFPFETFYQYIHHIHKCLRYPLT